jgi:hypothetical protein
MAKFRKMTPEERRAWLKEREEHIEQLNDLIRRAKIELATGKRPAA